MSIRSLSLGYPGVLALSLVLTLGLSERALATHDEPWPDLKTELFDDRPINDGAGVIALDAPYRAHDAAIVPLTMIAEIPQSPERFIKTITLVIDHNPVPVAAVFQLTPRNGNATISTRVRIDAYTNVRAIAETNDGQLYMATKFVKAAGGCAAPAVKDHDKAVADLGKMKLKQGAIADAGEPSQVQLLINHPNHSGFQRDFFGNYYIPAHFVQDIEVKYGDETILTVEGAISLSEDPSIHFSYVPDGTGEISVWVRDSEDQTFTGSWPVAASAES